MTYRPKIEYNHTLETIRDRVFTKKKKLDNYRPLSADIVNKIRNDFAIEWTYNSNHIEGNTLTLAETKMVLEDGITIGGKTLREHFEVINHKKAIHYLDSLVDQSNQIRSIDLLTIHEIVMHNILDDFAGRLRQGMVRIVGANFTPPNARKVPVLLDQLLEYINTNPNKYDVIALATLFHHRFVWIHPFTDGNGRTVRLAMNLLLLRVGFPPVYILTQDRKKYISALNQANNGNYNKLLLMMYQAVERSLDIYLNTIGGDYEDYEPTADIAEDPSIPYGQEYLSLLARRGRIDAFKERGKWLTTKSAVLQYQKEKLK